MSRAPDLRNVLRKGSLLFLVLPQLIFLFGWVRLPLALLVGIPLSLAVWQAGFRSRVEPVGFFCPARCPWKWVVAVLLPALVVTFLSGAGGWGGGDSDWLKHDTLLRDLVTHPWPVSYQTDQGPVLLVYYLAFYLPAALLGKLAGVSGYWLASQIIALTTCVGLALSAGWLIVLGRPSRYAADAAENNAQIRETSNAPVWLGAAVFFGFSGLDPLGKLLINLSLRIPALSGDWSDVEWWAQFAQYSSNAATVFWAPQHAFGAWLPAALVMDDWFADRRRLEASWVLYLSCAVLWSPFAALGLAAVIGGMLFWRWAGTLRRTAEPGTRNERAGWRRCLTWTNAGGAVAVVCFASYLLAHFQSFYLPAAYLVTAGRHPMPLLEQSHFPWIALYFGFVAIEFGGLSLALALSLRRSETGFGEKASRATHGPLLVVATLVLLILPWFHYGFANDLVMRGGIPALFVLQVLLVRLLVGAMRRPEQCTPAPSAVSARWPAVVAGCLLLGGLVNVGLEYRRHILRIVAQGSLRDARTLQPVRSLAELQRTVYARPGFDFSRQYLGSADSFFARHVARRDVIPSTSPANGNEVDF